MAKKLNKLGVENSLWNNIRANKGSGKAPTKEMLKQERKINAKYEKGGTTDKPRFPGKLNVNLVDDMYVKPSVTKDLNIKKQIANSTVPVSNWPTNKNKNAVAKVSIKSNSKFPGKLETNLVDDTYVAPAVSDMRSAEQKKLDYKNYKDNQKLGKSVQNVALQTALDQVKIPYTSGIKNDRKSIPIGTMINAANDVNDLPSFSNPFLGVVNTSLNKIKPKVPVMGDLAVNVLQEGLQRGDEEYATNDFKAKKYLKEKGIDPKNIGYIKPFAKGGKVPVSAGGEKHLIYRKLSPTGNGEGVKGHIMVNHPTMDKGKWDTIDLTDVADVNTVNQGIAATKKWHAENPEYAMGGYTMYGNGGINNPGFRALPENIQKKILAKMAMGGNVLPKFGKGGNKPGTWNGTDASGNAIKTNFANSTAGENVVTGAGIAGAAVPMLTSFIPDDKVTDSEGNEIGSEVSLGKGVLNGAAQGASMGAAAGPWGAAIGAGVGAIYGGITTNMANDDVRRERNQANMRINNKNITNSVMTNKNMYSTNISNNDQMIAARGGTVVNEDMGNPNAELELNETFRDPMTGETGMVDGPSHDNGGIEMSLAEGTQIWSDRLKHNGRTFASLTKPIINKIANIEKGLDTNPNSRFKQNSIKLLNAQLDFFFDIQESNKQQDEMKRTLKKQEGGVVDDMGNYHYANGGIYIKPENRGKFTAYKERTGKTTEEALHSPDPHVRQMANFAKNAAGWKHAEGGMVQYPWGGLKNMFNRNRQPAPAAIPTNISNTNPNGSYNAFSNKGLPANTWEEEFAGPSVNNTQGLISKNMNPGTQIPLGPANRPEGYIDYTNVNTPETMQGRQLPNYSLPKPALSQVYNSTSYIQPKVGMNGLRKAQGDYENTFSGMRNAQGEYENLLKLRGAQGEYENQPFTPDIVETANRPTNQSTEKNYNPWANAGIGVAAANYFAQNRNLNYAAPEKLNDVHLQGSVGNPRYVDLSAERGAINRSAMGAMGEAQRGFGNSATAQAFKNKARINQLEQAGKSYQNQENINAGIGNEFLDKRFKAGMAEADINNRNAQTNLENAYGDRASKAAARNQNLSLLSGSVGDVFANKSKYQNDLEKEKIISNRYENKVWNSTKDNTTEENNSSLKAKQETPKTETAKTEATKPETAKTTETSTAPVTKATTATKPKTKPVVKPFVKKSTTAPLLGPDVSKGVGARTIKPKPKFSKNGL